MLERIGRRPPVCGALWFNWMVRTRDGVSAGTVQATIEHPGHPAALIGYIIFPSHWRRGLGREAVGCMLEWLFSSRLCDRAIALADTRNQASIGLLTGLGFTAVALHPDADFFHGETSHEIEFSLDRPPRYSPDNSRRLRSSSSV
jgi:RimJ/RimL family protein N-acetyltransferase